MTGNEFTITEKPILNEEQQKLLLNFLLNILKDTKSIHIKCDCSHEDLYYQINKSMNELNLVNIKEEWNIDNPNTWKVKIDFLYPLRNLVEIWWKK